MANAFDSYLRGKQSAMQQGQQQFAMEQAVQKMQRERKMQGIMSQSYDQEAGSFDQSGAYNQLMSAGFLPEAMQIKPKAKPGFTLGEGQIRYDASGKEIARGRNKPGSQFMPETDKQAPWRNILDSKKRDEAKIRFGAKAEGQVESLRSKSGLGKSMNRDIDRFLFLNETNDTGAGYAVWGAKGARGAFDPEFAEMQSISDKLTPQMRQGMPGAASDRDVAMFRSATVGVEREHEANVNIGTGLKAANQNKIDKANFFSEYLMNRGHTRGADQEWNQYLEANPIFDPNAPDGSYALNKNRKTVQEYAREKTGGQAGARIGQQAPQAAIDYLMKNNNPVIQQQFKAKYGYLP